MNPQLRSALEESGMSGQALRYDYTAVGRWVNKGQIPRQPVPTRVAQALSERLGRRVTPEELGMTSGVALATDSLKHQDEAADAFQSIIALGADEVQGGSAKSAPFVVEAFGPP